MRVRERIAALDTRECLVVRQRVQVVAVEIVEGCAAVNARSTLRRDDDAGQAAVFGTVGVREHADLRHRIEARRGVTDRSEDGVCRCLAILDVRHAVRLAAQELDVVGATDDVGVEEQERLDVAAVARKIVELLLIEPAGDGRVVERDVVDQIGGHGDRLVQAAQLEGDVHQRGARGAQHDTGPLELLEVLCDDLDTIRAGPDVRSLVAPLRVGFERAGHIRRLVGDQHRGAGNDLPLGIADRAADRPQK